MIRITKANTMSRTLLSKVWLGIPFAVYVAGCRAVASPEGASAPDRVEQAQPPSFSVRWQTTDPGEPATWTISFYGDELYERARRISEEDLREVFSPVRALRRVFVIRIYLNPRVNHSVAKIDEAVKRIGRVAAEVRRPGDSTVVWLKVTRDMSKTE